MIVLLVSDNTDLVNNLNAMLVIVTFIVREFHVAKASMSRN